MAKELPYFQFEPAQYLTGNIQFCSMEEQGVFINVCAVYWQRSCSATKEQLIRKFNSDNIHRLIAEDVIKCSATGEITIDFLDEQFKEISRRKELCSEGGKKSAASKKATMLQGSSKVVETPFQHLDKIREDEIREKESVNGISENDLNLIHAHASVFKKTVENDIWLDDMASTLQTSRMNIKKYTEQKFKEWKISGTLTKYSLGTLIGWLIKDYKQQHGKVIEDYEQEQRKARNSNQAAGDTDRLFGKE